MKKEGEGGKKEEGRGWGSGMEGSHTHTCQYSLLSVCVGGGGGKREGREGGRTAMERDGGALTLFALFRAPRGSWRCSNRELANAIFNTQ